MLNSIHLIRGQNGDLGNLFRDRGYPKERGGKEKNIGERNFPE